MMRMLLLQQQHCRLLLAFVLLLECCSLPYSTAFAPAGLRSIPQRQRRPPQQVLPRPERTSPFLRSAQRWSTTTTQYTEDNKNEEEDDSSTVTTLWNPVGDQCITLIGTAHLSKKSNAQVQRLMEQIQPNIVLIELDPSRLKRLGIPSLKDIQLKNVITSEAIPLPQEWDRTEKSEFLTLLFQPIQQVVTDALSRLARVFLTGMYKDMSVSMNTTEGGGGGGPGGEFLVAIRAAEKCTACDTLILGDRNSVATIQRAMMLAIQSGDPLGVLNRLQAVNGMEMEQLAQRVEKDLQEQEKARAKADPNNLDPNTKIVIDQGAIQVAMMEALKQDSTFRETLFRKLEQQVPEFTQAFLKERDYLMAESIRRELLQYSTPSVPKRVIGVVGLAHVPGMVQHLQETANFSIIAPQEAGAKDQEN